MWIPEDEFCIPGMDSAYLEMYSGCVEMDAGYLEMDSW